MGKCRFSRNSQCFEFKLSQVECYGVFGGGESFASTIFHAWVGPGPRNFVFFRFFRYKNVTFIGKVNFLAINCLNSGTLGVFMDGESISSNIFDAWTGSGPKNLECNVFVTLKS